MKNPNDHIVPLYTKAGELHGVFLSPELWARVKARVLPILESQFDAPCEELPEPIKDWEQLKELWGFQYPVDMDVSCAHCGNSTDDWSKDEPRKFRLAAANLGGLVTFACQGCRAKILKRHFKREIKVECHPFQETKNQRKEAPSVS